MKSTTVSLYLARLQARGVSARYLVVTRSILERFGAADAQARLDDLASRATQQTVADHVRRLEAFRRWCVACGEAEPFAPLRIPRAHREAQARSSFTPEEVRRLVTCRAVPEDRRVLWRILAHTGLRPVEASRVRPEHVTQESGRWVLRLPGGSQKSGRPDPIFLLEEDAQAIRRLGEIVPSAVGHLSKVLAADLRAAGLPVVREGSARTPYTLRRFFVTELIRSGLNPETVRQLARHSDVAVTLRHYTQIAAEEAWDSGLTVLRRLAG